MTVAESLPRFGTGKTRTSWLLHFLFRTKTVLVCRLKLDEPSFRSQVETVGLEAFETAALNIPPAFLENV